MKNKKIWIAIAVLLAVCIGVLWANVTSHLKVLFAPLVENKTGTQTSPQVTYIATANKKDTLKGLHGVFVIVEDLKPGVEKYGLTEQQLQTDVELRLRQNSIKVLSEQEWLSTPGKPYLYVNVCILIREEITVAAYHISLELKQAVLLERDPTKSCHASTWVTGLTGSVGWDKITSAIREDAKDCVDEFINDYLAVNPKK